MFLVYLLIFLLHLSSSACDATSRNHRLLLTTAAGVPAPSPSTTSRHDHHTTMHVYSSHAYVHAATMMQHQQQGSPSPPDMELRGAVEGVLPPEQEGNAATMEPSPREDGGGYKEVGGDGVGGEGGSSGVADDDQQERKVDVGIDYAPPKTHPPSHN